MKITSLLKKKWNLAPVAAAAGLVSLSGCSPDRPTSPGSLIPPQPTFTTVTFRYVSPVPADMPPADLENLTACVHHYAPVAGGWPTLQASWTDRFYRSTSEEGGEVVVPDVPVGREEVVRVWDLRMCNVNAKAEPVSYRTIFANGVELTRVVVHRSGMEGAALTVAPNGIVTP